MSVVGPGVVPRRNGFNSLDCQTALIASMGTIGFSPGCKTARSSPTLCDVRYWQMRTFHWHAARS